MYSDLFGTKTIEGRPVNVEALIARMTAETRDAFRELLQARHKLQARVAGKTASYDFLDGAVTVGDPDGNQATVSEIRQGMLDGFFNRQTPKGWRVASGRPIPPTSRRRASKARGRRLTSAWRWAR